MRELKQLMQANVENVTGRTPPGVRELKRAIYAIEKLMRLSRTPPGVRELKQ